MGRGQVHLLIIEKKNEHPLLAKGVRPLECFYISAPFGVSLLISLWLFHWF